MNKKVNIIILLIILLSSFNFGIAQNWAEFEKHLRSIDSTFTPGYTIVKPDTIVNVNRAFVDYTIRHLLLRPSDKYYISNRNLLPKLKNTYCDSICTKFNDTLKAGEICQVIIATKKFIPDSNRVLYKDDEVAKINGCYPYGGEYGFPSYEIGEFQILIDGKPLKIPRKAYRDLFDPVLCACPGCERKVEVYSSLDGQFIYVYFYGGEAADTYYTKLIFNKQKYVTRIIADYYSLSANGSFRDNFIGF